MKPKYTTRVSAGRGTKPDRYTFDEIWYMDGGVLTCGDDDLRVLVAKALSRIPRDVVDRVIDDVLFIPGHKSFIINKEFLRRQLMKDDGDVRAIIVISGDAIRKRDIRDVLHEVAHYWLGHADDSRIFDAFSVISVEEVIRQEEEADELVEKWMKGGKE